MLSVRIPFSKYIKSLLIVFFLLLGAMKAPLLASHNEPVKPVKIIDSTAYYQRLDSLRAQYGNNKKIPARFELPILIALSHYPELKDTRIVFKEDKISTTLNARPTAASLIFKKRSKRTYVVRINNSPKEGVINLDEVPFNAQIGVLAHEFSHFVDYQERNFFGVCQRMCHYASKHHKEVYEKEIDWRTINKGLGWQLHDWSHYVLHQSDAPEEYKAFKRNTYLKPEEIKTIMRYNHEAGLQDYALTASE